MYGHTGGAGEWSLNPYSNGICSMSYLKNIRSPTRLLSLNPYSNGICSMRVANKLNDAVGKGLNPYSNGICSMSAQSKTYRCVNNTS